nr:hypothetical protein [Tanacetum cinerariifolium]
MMKAQVHVSKSSTISGVQALPLKHVLRIILVVIARTFRVILFSIHSDEWKSFQSQHQSALRGVKIQDPPYSIIKDKYMMNAQVHVSKSSTISGVQAFPLRKHYCQIYQVVKHMLRRRLLASFQDHEHEGGDTRSQDGIKDNDSDGNDKVIMILELFNPFPYVWTHSICPFSMFFPHPLHSFHQPNPDVLQHVDDGLSSCLNYKYRCARTWLITPELTCPSTHQLLWNSDSDPGPDLSFDKSASLERLFSLARVSLTEASKLDLSFGCCSCMKHWKSGFFLIDRRAILDVTVLRHLDATIDDPRPDAGSFNMVDVRRLSAHVIKLMDMPKGVLVLSGSSRVWKNRFCDLVLCGADGNVMGIHDFLCLPEWTDAEVQEEPHLDVRPTLQKLSFYCTSPAAADAKQKASTSGATSSHVAKRTNSALAQSSDSTTQPSLFAGDDDESDDDDACMEIPLVTPFHFAAVIHSSRKQDSRGKGIMVDDAAAPSGGVSRQRPSSRPAPSFRDVSGDAIHTDFFPFFAGPYYALIPRMVLLETCLTLGEMVRVEGLSDNQLTAKMSVLHCMMLSHGGELLARYRRLNQSHHEYVLSIDSRLKGYEEEVAGLTGLELQVSTLKKQISGLNDKLATFDASFAKSKAKGKEKKKKIKSLSKSLDNLHSEVAYLSATLNQATIFEAERDEEILRLKVTPPEFSSFFRGQFQGLVWKFLASDEFIRVQGELLSLAANAGFERGLSMHRTKDEFTDVLKKMVNFMPGAQKRLAEASPFVAQTDYAFINKISEYAAEPLSVILQLEPEKLLSANVAPVSSAVASEQNEEQVNAVVDGSDLEMVDGVSPSKSGGVFVQGVSHVLDYVVEETAVESERISSIPTDVVVALYVGGKGDGSVPSSTIEEVVVPPSGV